MVSYHLIKAKFFIIILFLMLHLFYVHSHTLLSQPNLDHNNNNNSDSETPLLNNNDKHQAQIDKLEQIVKNLSDLVERLESKFVESTKFPSFEKLVKDDVGGFRGEEGIDNRFKTKPGFGSGSGSGSGSVTKYSPFWSEKFQFMSAVSLDSVATSVNVLPFRDYEGFTKYIAVGDDHGRVYIFLRNGDVLVEFYTLSRSPVTSMLSYMSAFMNESVLVTGHRNGLVLIHRVWETSLGEESSSLHMENLMGLDSLGEIEPRGSQISVLEVHQVGRSKYILSVDEAGKIKVLRENGTLYGIAVPTSRPLVFLKQRLLFLMEKGAGSLDLRTMKIRETTCEGLNDSVVKNFVFDANERSKAYGFTSSGDLIHVLLLGDVMNFKCRVRSRKRFDMDEPLAFQAIKGYLLIIGQEKIYVYNVSTQHYIRSGAPRHTFSASIDEIKSSFLPSQTVDGDIEKENVIPLIASDREKLVIVGLGGGYVGMYRSKLPVLKGESNTMLWTSPVLFFIVFLFVAWQFFAKKKEALTSWGPDDPFNSTSVTSGAPLESSRNTDTMDLRNNGLRGGPPRRYPSPPRYNRVNSVETNSRTSSVDPNYNRANSELKFRATNLESSGFPNRRDMFGNSQIVDDGN